MDWNRIEDQLFKIRLATKAWRGNPELGMLWVTVYEKIQKNELR